VGLWIDQGTLAALQRARGAGEGWSEGDPEALLAAHGRALGGLRSNRKPLPGGGKIGRGIDQNPHTCVVRNIPGRRVLTRACAAPIFPDVLKEEA
jgi:hypothetical protein